MSAEILVVFILWSPSTFVYYVMKIRCFIVGQVYCSCSACCGCVNVKIPTTNTSIKAYAFNNCSGTAAARATQLRNVIIPT